MESNQYEGGMADARLSLEQNERPGVFRKRYRKLDEQELARMDEIKDRAQGLLSLIDAAYGAEAEHQGTPYLRPAGREHSIARTKLEESIMWAVKGLTS